MTNPPDRAGEAAAPVAGTWAAAAGPREPPPPAPALEFARAFVAHRAGALAAGVLAVLVVAALLAPWIAPHDPIAQHRDHLLVPPAWQSGGMAAYPMGTDDLGRCVLSRLLHGARVSLAIAAASVGLALLPGVLLGLLAAFHPRWAAPLVLRAVDILLALPGLLLAICVVTVLGPGLVNTAIAIAIGALPGYVRLTRASALAELPREYVVASRMAGAGTWRLMWRTVLPNCVAPLVVAATLSFSSAILETAALGFLGLGVQAPRPEWGSMLSAARDFIERAPWLVTLPGLAILVTVLCINLVGDGLRDALDPRLRRAA